MKKAMTEELVKTNGDGALQELIGVLESGGYRTTGISPGKESPVPDPAKVKPPEAPPGPAPEWKDKGNPEAKGLDWKKKNIPVKTTVVRCIVIDRYDRWHENAQVDLHGMDTAAFTWGNYGTSYPVLVEDDQGKLQPWYLPDAAGESSNRLYKGANPEGFRNTFRHRSTTLQKIQVGLMVALVLGLFFIMFILINQ